MNGPGVPRLGEALDLIRSIEAACEELEESCGTDAEDAVATLRDLARDIRVQLSAIADQRGRPARG